MVKKSGVVNILIILSSIILISLFSISIVATVNDTAVPDTNVVYATKDNGQDKRMCEDDWMYVNFNANNIVINFYSQDSQSKLKKVEYIRSDWDTYWKTGNGLNNNSISDYWYSDPNDLWEDENYRVCGRARDMAENQENADLSVDNVSEDDCCNLCIDKENPIMDSIRDNTEDCSSEGKYWNQNSIDFSWTAHDNGCAGVDYYIVKLYENEELIDTQETSSANWTALSLADGKSYYITVTPVDKAGNQGSYMTSDVIKIDLTNPTVEITSPADGSWFKDNLNVAETDSDANLLRCEYQIDDLSWNSITCNTILPIDISTLSDGQHSITKKAVDKACNSNQDSIKVNIDRTAPVTTKIIGEPKISPWGEWIAILTNGWFITNDTEISFSCSDAAGIGCDKTYYRINGGNWTEYTNTTLIKLSPDEVYIIEYYSIDKLGNTETIKSETDKVDTLAPETTKTLGEPKYVNNEKTWVTSNTNFTLTCNDSEVGCYETYYRINGGVEQTYVYPFNLQGYEDGEHTIYYYSIDKLLNIESENNETDWLDTTAPLIQILNPTKEEAESIERCIQSIVVIVNDGEGSGIKKVWAELWNSTDKIKEVDMAKTVSGTYQALMDKQLPAGEYTLKVYAEDNAENKGIKEQSEILKQGVFVEYIEDPICKINPATGGECDFTFHICTRNSNAVSMKMKKLAEVVTPEMMNAKISKENETAFVYLWDPAITDVDILKLSDEIINGITDFKLHLEVPANVSSRIGKGEHKLDYLIESYSD